MNDLLSPMLVGMAIVSTALPCALVFACENLTVAQALLQTRRDIHSLLVIGPSADPQTQAEYERLLAWTQGPGQDLNLAVQRVHSDDPHVVWSDHGFAAAPRAERMTALVARHTASKLSLLVDEWIPAPGEGDLTTLRDSPLRERLRAEAPLHLAAIVHPPGTSEDTAEDTRTLLDSVAREWHTERDHDIVLLTLERTDPAERTLVQFTNLQETDAGWVGVFAGRGVMLFPPLRGDAVTRTAITRLLETLAGPCICIENPRALGVEIPILWTDADETLASAFSAPRYTEQLIGGMPPPADFAAPETLPKPRVLAAGATAAGIMCLLSLGVVVTAWLRYNRRNRPETEGL